MVVLRYDIDPKLDSYQIVAGELYLCDEERLNDFPRRTTKPSLAEECCPEKPFSPFENWNNKKILAIRHGAFGDLLFLTPTFAEIKRRWPDAKIFICCANKYSEAIFNNEDVDGIISYPIKLSEANSFDAIINFVYTNEYEKRNSETHIIDLFSGLAGLTVSDKKLKLNIHNSEGHELFEKYPKSRLTRIGIQVFASNAIRSYPFFQLEKLIDKLWWRGYEVMLFGSPNQVSYPSRERIVNLTKLNPAPSFTQSATIIKTCDLFLAPDSSLCHVAGALQIPTIAIYGSFPAKLRTAYATSITSIQGEGNCAPCFHHTFNGRQFPENMPCENSGHCNVLASIDSDEIFSIVEKKLGNTKAL